MSWNLSTQGTHDAARQKVEADPQVPAEVKQATAALLSTFAPEKDVQLTTHGHVDQAAKTGNATITINTV